MTLAVRHHRQVTRVRLEQRSQPQIAQRRFQVVTAGQVHLREENHRRLHDHLADELFELLAGEQLLRCLKSLRVRVPRQYHVHGGRVLLVRKSEDFAIALGIVIMREFSCEMQI